MNGPAGEPLGGPSDDDSTGDAQHSGGTASGESSLRGEVADAASPGERAEALTELAKFLLHAGDERVEEACGVLDEAIVVANDAGDSRRLYLARVVRARAARVAGDDDENRNQLSQALVLCEAIGARRPLPELLMLLSNVDVRAGDLDSARVALERALEQAIENDDEHQVARVRVEFGRLERRADDLDAAQAHLELALEAIRERGPIAVRTTVEHDLAALLQASGDYRSALEHYGHARDGWSELDRRDRVAGCLVRMAEMDRLLGARDEAKVHLAEALGIAQGLGDERRESEIRCSLGDVARMTSEYPEAERQFVRALQSATNRDDERIEAKALAGLASVDRVARRLDEASARLERCRAVAAQFDDTYASVNASIALGSIQALRGDRVGARELYGAGRQMATNDGYHLGVANASHGLGLLSVGEGDVAAAKNELDRCLRFASELGERHGLVHAHNGWSMLALVAGASERAVSEAETALRLAEEVDYRMAVGTATRLLGIAALASGDHARSAKLLRRSESIASEIGDVGGALYSSSALAECDIGAQRLGEATRRLAAAREAFESQRDPGGLAEAQRRESMLSLANGRSEEALGWLRVALAGFSSLDARPRLAVTGTELALLELDLDRPDEARRSASVAVLAAEQIRETLVPELPQAGFFLTYRSVYELAYSLGLAD